MKYLLLLLTPISILSQDNFTNERGSYGQYYDGQKTNRKHVLKNVVGSRYYHKDYVYTVIDGKNTLIKFDAYSDMMEPKFGPGYLPYSNKLKLLLNQNETWIAFNNKWFRLIFEDKESTYLLKPIVEYVKAKKAEEGYGGNQPAKFVMKERYYVLENGILTKLKKKEVKKLGLLKILSK